MKLKDLKKVFDGNMEVRISTKKKEKTKGKLSDITDKYDDRGIDYAEYDNDILNIQISKKSKKKKSDEEVDADQGIENIKKVIESYEDEETEEESVKYNHNHEREKNFRENRDNNRRNNHYNKNYHTDSSRSLASHHPHPDRSEEQIEKAKEIIHDINEEAKKEKANTTEEE